MPNTTSTPSSSSCATSASAPVIFPVATALETSRTKRRRQGVCNARHAPAVCRAMSRILAIDAGTTGVTALVVSEEARVVAKGYREFPQHFPRPGWVEHDANEIWHAALDAVGEALGAARIGARDLAAIGITNQRETTVLWDRKTLEPVHNAIVWQDRRTADLCDSLRNEGWEERVRGRTGLVIDPYFSGTKLAWLL